MAPFAIHPLHHTGYPRHRVRRCSLLSGSPLSPPARPLPGYQAPRPLSQPELSTTTLPPVSPRPNSVVHSIVHTIVPLLY